MQRRYAIFNRLTLRSFLFPLGKLLDGQHPLGGHQELIVVRAHSAGKHIVVEGIIHDAIVYLRLLSVKIFLCADTVHLWLTLDKKLRIIEWK